MINLWAMIAIVPLYVLLFWILPGLNSPIEPLKQGLTGVAVLHLLAAIILAAIWGMSHFLYGI